MAYYENLPIYKKSMELAVYMENVEEFFEIPQIHNWYRHEGSIQKPGSFNH